MSVLPQKTAKHLLIAVVFIASLAILIEIGARVYLDTHMQPTTLDILLTHPAAYGDAPYYGPAFINEMMGITYQLSATCNCFLPDDASGRWFNVLNHVRITADQPQNAPCSIYLFGNSTVWGSFLPDKQTLASYLQRLALPCRVVNLGFLSQGTGVDLARLKTIDIQPQDTVIFYTGVNEVLDTYRAAASKEYDASLCNHIPHRLSNLATAKLICQVQNLQVPQIVNDNPALARLGTEIAKTYGQTIQAARQYTQQHGAAFYNFLQPQLWVKPLSHAELNMAENPVQTAPQIGIMFKAIYPNLERADPYTIDLTHVLDSVRDTGELVFFDCCHVNARANALIATTIWQYIHEI